MIKNNVVYKIGDLLTCGADLIVHQCNTTSIGARGLAQQVFKTYPSASYQNNPKRKVGTCKIFQNRVVNLYAQRYPGRPRNHKYRSDRLMWLDFAIADFEAQLSISLRLSSIKSIAFPYNFGCDLAGGKWDVYIRRIDNFANGFCARNQIKVYVVARV